MHPDVFACQHRDLHLLYYFGTEWCMILAVEPQQTAAASFLVSTWLARPWRRRLRMRKCHSSFEMALLPCAFCLGGCGIPDAFAECITSAVEPEPGWWLLCRELVLTSHGLAGFVRAQNAAFLRRVGAFLSTRSSWSWSHLDEVDSGTP